MSKQDVIAKIQQRAQMSQLRQSHISETQKEARELIDSQIQPYLESYCEELRKSGIETEVYSTSDSEVDIGIALAIKSVPNVTFSPERDTPIIDIAYTGNAGNGFTATFDTDHLGEAIHLSTIPFGINNMSAAIDKVIEKGFSSFFEQFEDS